MEKEPLEVRAQKSGYPSDAYHDPSTGMYTKPEHVDGTDKEFGEILTENGRSIFIPKPKLKPIRKIQFAVPFAWIDVIESMARCQELVNQARQDDGPEWVPFVEPIYGNAVYVRRDKLAEACWIMEGFTDLEAFELQTSAAEHQKRMALLQARSQKRLG